MQTNFQTVNYAYSITNPINIISLLNPTIWLYIYFYPKPKKSEVVQLNPNKYVFFGKCPSPNI